MTAIGSFLGGFGHPLHGADHVVAMIAVGIWAVQYSGRSGGWLPVVFCAGMAPGLAAGFGLASAPLGGIVELAVALSAVALALTCRSRPALSRALGLCALAGLLHGLVHGTEAAMAGAPGPQPFVGDLLARAALFVGMMAGTAVLHACGVLIGRALHAQWRAWRLARPVVYTSLGASVLAPSAGFAQGVDLPRPTSPPRPPGSTMGRSVAELEPVEVRGHYDNAVGTADAASAGRIHAQLLETRPPLRPAEVLEYVPGVVVTQHSGDGKANQYFLRGFNLDHGTDFATWVDGMPVNLPTHAHGHGYTDLNFLMPEVIDTLDYAKGPYRAVDGDFSSAGSARIGLKNRLDGSTGIVTLGERGYRRLFAGYSPGIRDGRGLLLAMEAQAYDGPWTVPQDHRRLNGVLRWSDGTRTNGWSATLMGYDGNWTATDQVPARAVDGGRLGRFGSLDPTTGGRSARYSASVNWARSLGDGAVQASVYAIRYSLNLFSNFTYALERPDTGDQFEQADRRTVSGLRLSRRWDQVVGGRPVGNELGIQGRMDRIRVGLFDTEARQRLDTVRSDRVRQSSLGVYGENTVQWHDKLRTVAGLRADRYDFRVRGDSPENGGRGDDSLLSPKLSLIVGPWNDTEGFLNWGRGFHSNDARGTLTRFDPRCLRTSGAVAECAVDPVPGLVRSTGYEVGLRTEALPGLQSSLSLWRLDIGSELVFVGDAGTTEPSRPSRRHGIEISQRYVPRPWLLFDLDLAWTRARFRDQDDAGSAIPGAVARVGAFAMTVRDRGPWSGTLALRYLGPRPLVEDGRVTARSFTLANLRVGYRWNRQVQTFLDVFNLFDRRANDIEYFYESRISGESSAVADRHFHPVEPRTVRLSLKVTP